MKMHHGFSWQYDEFKQVGTDYSSNAEVEIYDASHADFRDIEAESIKVLDLLEIEGDKGLIDFGSGTGTFAIQAASRWKQTEGASLQSTNLMFGDLTLRSRSRCIWG